MDRQGALGKCSWNALRRLMVHVPPAERAALLQAAPFVCDEVAVGLALDFVHRVRNFTVIETTELLTFAWLPAVLERETDEARAETQFLMRHRVAPPQVSPSTLIGLLASASQHIFVPHVGHEWIATLFGAAAVDTACCVKVTTPEVCVTFHRFPRLRDLSSSADRELNPSSLDISTALGHVDCAAFCRHQLAASSFISKCRAGAMGAVLATLAQIPSEKRDNWLNLAFYPFRAKGDVGQSPAMTSLFAAVDGDSPDLVIYLLLQGADPRRSCDGSTTSFTHAAKRGFLQCLRILMGRATDHERQSALWIAASCGRLDVVGFLLDAGVDVNWVPSPARGPALLAAFRRGRRDVMHFLLNAGADPNVTFRDGEFTQVTLMHVLITPQWNRTVCEWLLARGALVNARRLLDGATPLHCAARLGADLIVTTLLDHGADISICDTDGKRPVDCVPPNASLKSLWRLKGDAAPPSDV